MLDQGTGQRPAMIGARGHPCLFPSLVREDVWLDRDFPSNRCVLVLLDRVAENAAIAGRPKKKERDPCLFARKRYKKQGESPFTHSWSVFFLQLSLLAHTVSITVHSDASSQNKQETPTAINCLKVPVEGD